MRDGARPSASSIPSAWRRTFRLVSRKPADQTGLQPFVRADHRTLEPFSETQPRFPPAFFKSLADDMATNAVRWSHHFGNGGASRDALMAEKVMHSLTESGMIS